MGFFEDVGDFFGTGATDGQARTMYERDKQAQDLAMREQKFVMSQVGFYAAVGGLVLITLIIAWKKL